MLYYDIINKIEQGYAPELLAIEFSINIQIINHREDNSKHIQTLKTRRSNPASRHSRTSALLQGKPPSSKELAFLDKITAKMRDEYPKKIERITNMLVHALRNQCMNQSGINFNWLEDLEYFLKAFENIIPKSYWRMLTYTIEHSSVLDEWEVAYKNIKTRKGKNQRRLVQQVEAMCV